MEREYVKAGAYTVWVIWDEIGRVFVSSRSLAVIFGYTKTSNMLKVYTPPGKNCYHVNRRDLPLTCRSEAVEDKHVFFLLDEQKINQK